MGSYGRKIYRILKKVLFLKRKFHDFNDSVSERVLPLSIKERRQKI